MRRTYRFDLLCPRIRLLCFDTCSFHCVDSSQVSSSQAWLVHVDRRKYNVQSVSLISLNFRMTTPTIFLIYVSSCSWKGLRKNWLFYLCFLDIRTPHLSLKRKKTWPPKKGKTSYVDMIAACTWSSCVCKLQLWTWELQQSIQIKVLNLVIKLTLIFLYEIK